MYEVNVKRSPGVAALGGALTIHSVSDARGPLLEAIDEAPALVVQLSELTHFDSAGLQLLLSAGREAARRGGQVRIEAPSEAVRRVLEVLRVDLGGDVGVRVDGPDDATRAHAEPASGLQEARDAVG